MGHEKVERSFVRSLTVEDYVRTCYEIGQKWFDEGSLRSAFLELLASGQTVASADNLGSAARFEHSGRIKHILGTLREKLGLKLKLSNLPPIPANPDSKKFTRLVLVVSKVTLQKLVHVQGIINYLNLDKVRVIVQTPNAPLYWLWMQAGECYQSQSVDAATALFAPYERGATAKEGLFLHLYNPEILNNCYMDFAGSRGGDGRAPCLNRWHGRPRLGADYPGNVFSCYGAVSCGSSA